MKKYYSLIFLLILFFSNAYLQAQNLISNGDFEKVISQPDSISDFNKVLDWTNPTQASPDYFNPYSSPQLPINAYGNQSPHSGRSFSGIITYSSNTLVPGYEYREYIQQKLAHPLEAGKTYYLEFFVSRADGFLQRYASNKLACAFSDNAILQSGDMHILGVNPDFEEQKIITESGKWTKISGCYTPSVAGIKYITIGNFEDNNHCSTQVISPLLSNAPMRAYYYIDDIGLFEIKAGFSYSKTMCSSEIYFKNQSTNSNTYQWKFDDGLSSSVMNPIHDYTQPGNYMVSLITSNGVCSDTFSLLTRIDSDSFKNFIIPTVFTPNGDGVNDCWQLNFTEACGSISIQIFNRWGQKLFDKLGNEICWDGKFGAEEMPESVYYYTLNYSDKKITKSGSFSLLR